MVTKSLLVAQVNERNQATCSNLHPPKTAHQSQRHHVRSSQATPEVINHPVLLQALEHVQQRTAARPMGDFPEMLRDSALWQPQTAAKDCHPNFGAFVATAQRMSNANVPNRFETALVSNWFMAPHKDPQRPDASRPTGMGTAWQCILGKCFVTPLQGPMTAKSLPHSTSLPHQMSQSRRPALPLNVTQNPATKLELSHSCLKNVFNKASRAAARDKLMSHPQL